MKMLRLLPFAVMFIGSTVLGQLAPAAPTQTTTTDSNTAAIIAFKAQQAQIERWRILQDTQTKIFEIQQDVTVNKSKTNDRTFQMYDQYIRSGPDSSVVKSPSVQSSGRITIAPASGGPPAPGDAPSVSFTMRVLLFLSGAGPLNRSLETPIWESDPLTTTADGYGTFDYDLSFADPAAFVQALSDTDILQVQTQFIASYDTTNVLGDDVNFVIGTGLDPYADLPETGLSFVVVPEPTNLAVFCVAGWLVTARRKRVSA